MIRFVVLGPISGKQAQLRDGNLDIFGVCYVGVSLSNAGLDLSRVLCWKSQCHLLGTTKRLQRWKT